MLQPFIVPHCAEELSVSGNPEDPEKADMRIVQASAQEVCIKQMIGLAVLIAANIFALCMFHRCWVSTVRCSTVV